MYWDQFDQMKLAHEEEDSILWRTVFRADSSADGQEGEHIKDNYTLLAYLDEGRTIQLAVYIMNYCVVVLTNRTRYRAFE